MQFGGQAGCSILSEVWLFYLPDRCRWSACSADSFASASADRDIYSCAAETGYAHLYAVTETGNPGLYTTRHASLYAATSSTNALGDRSVNATTGNATQTGGATLCAANDADACRRATTKGDNCAGAEE